jgi:hypothetical protein
LYPTIGKHLAQRQLVVLDFVADAAKALKATPSGALVVKNEPRWAPQA